MTAGGNGNGRLRLRVDGDGHGVEGESAPGAWVQAGRWSPLTNHVLINRRLVVAERLRFALQPMAFQRLDPPYFTVTALVLPLPVLSAPGPSLRLGAVDAPTVWDFMRSQDAESSPF